MKISLLPIAFFCLLPSCETSTTYHPDGSRTVIQRVMPGALENVHITVGEPQK